VAEEEMHRLFVAVELPDEWHQALAAQQRLLERRLGEAARGLRFVGQEAFHVTLLFLGETPATEEPDVQKAVTLAASECRDVDLRLGAPGTFGGRQPRVVWSGVEGDITGLAALRERLIRLLNRPQERQQFAAHVTLARVREGRRLGPQLQAALQNWPTAAAAPFTLQGISLMQSQLRPEGPRYTRRFFAPFRRPDQE
jgi:2'-5' RNA ligase